MKVATTIQISTEEDKEIVHLKKALGLPSKKAVVLQGLQVLRQYLGEQRRRGRLQAATRLVAKDSLRATREWAPQSSAMKTR